MSNDFLFFDFSSMREDKVRKGDKVYSKRTKYKITN